MIDWKVKVDKSYEERNTMQLDRAVIEATRKNAELIEQQNEILQKMGATLTEIRQVLVNSRALK